MYQQAVARNFDQWSELVSSSFVPLHAEPVRAGSFTGELSVRRLGDTVMTKVSSLPHMVHRGHELISLSDPAYCKISFQQSGHGLLIQNGRETLIGPGQFAIYDTSRPYTLVFDADSTSYVLMVPRVRFDVDDDALAQLTATMLGERHPLSAAVAQFALQCGQLLPGLDDGTGRRLTANVVDLLSTVMTDELYSRGPAGPARRADHQRQLKAVLDYIDHNLADPRLDPQRIAEAHFVSLRSLHQLFDGTGHTVAATIRSHRLQRCRDDLSDPAQRRTPVATIGARWGLMDPAHFSRIFRQAYGQSPSQFRAQA